MKDKTIILELNEIVEDLPTHIKDFVKEHAYVAGGCFHSMVNGQKVNDYDFYFKTKQAVEDFKTLTQARPNYRFLPSKNAINYNGSDIKLQFITSFWGTPKDVIAKFDFKHCMSYLDLNTQQLKMDRPFLLSNYLEFNLDASFPAKALERIIKCVAEKKMRLSGKTLADLVVGINSLDLSTKGALITHLTGMYGYRFIEKADSDRYLDFLKHKKFDNKLENLINES